MTSVDVPARRVTVGPPEASYAAGLALDTVAWVDGPPVGLGRPAAPPRWPSAAPTVRRSACTVRRRRATGSSVRFAEPQRRVAPGQTVALYDPDRPDRVVGSGVVR